MCLQCFDAVGWVAGRKTEWWGAGAVICLERGADLHMAQLMPLPLTASCISKIQIGFYRAMLCIRGTSHGLVSVRPSVCLSVCPSHTHTHTMWSAVWPMAFGMLISSAGNRLPNATMAFVLSLSTADCTGVRPALSTASVSAPTLIDSLTTSARSRSDNINNTTR